MGGARYFILPLPYWVGSDPAGKVDAIMCIIDLMKRDSEIKILIGCTEEEKALVYEMHNETEWMKGILIRDVIK